MCERVQLAVSVHYSSSTLHHGGKRLHEESSRLRFHIAWLTAIITFRNEVGGISTDGVT